MASIVESALTVVIPTHNRVDLLQQTLRSVEEQSPRPPIIVVDDGSTDGTPEALAGRNVVLVRNPAGGWGAGRARNNGLERVETPFVAFVDSDDLVMPHALSDLVGALVAAPRAPFAFGQGFAAFRDADGWRPEGIQGPTRAERRGSLVGGLYARNFVPSSGTVVRTEAARSVHGFDVSLEFSEDQDFWLRLGRIGEPAHVARLTVVHRRHGGNRHTSAVARRDNDEIAERGLANGETSVHLPARLGVQLCEEMLDAARARRPTDAVGALRRGLLGQSARRLVLAAGLRHFRLRHAAADAGLRLWQGDADLRRWLNGYA